MSEHTVTLKFVYFGGDGTELLANRQSAPGAINGFPPIPNLPAAVIGSYKSGSTIGPAILYEEPQPVIVWGGVTLQQTVVQDGTRAYHLAFFIVLGASGTTVPAIPSLFTSPQNLPEISIGDSDVTVLAVYWYSFVPSSTVAVGIYDVLNQCLVNVYDSIESVAGQPNDESLAICANEYGYLILNNEPLEINFAQQLSTSENSKFYDLDYNIIFGTGYSANASDTPDPTIKLLPANSPSGVLVCYKPTFVIPHAIGGGLVGSVVFVDPQGNVVGKIFGDKGPTLTVVAKGTPG